MNPSANIKPGTYVVFKYRATNGICEAMYEEIAKIHVSCKRRGAAPDISVIKGTAITPELLIAEGAGCMGCAM